MLLMNLKSKFATSLVLALLGVTTIEAAERGATKGITSNTVGRETIRAPKPARPSIIPVALSCAHVASDSQYAPYKARHIYIEATEMQPIAVGTKIKWTIPSVGKSGVFSVMQKHLRGKGVEYQVYDGPGLPKSVQCHARIVKR